MIDSKLQSAKAFQSTPSAWRETREIDCSEQCPSISIHSLRMEGDTVQKQH